MNYEPKGQRMTIEDKKINKSLERLGRSVAEREANKIYQMSFWGDEQRSIPNDLVRSALFAATKKISKELIRNKVVFSQSGITISYTGARLNQDHLAVFEGVMHLAREKSQGEMIEFTEHGLLKLIGRNVGGSDHKRLLQTLTDLTATAVKIKADQGGAVYWGSLLPEGAAKPDQGIYRVRLNREIIKLFDRGYTLLEHEQRKKLARSPLAKALQGYYASHKNPYPVTVAFLQELTGVETEQKKHFKANLKRALDKLVNIGFLKSWHIDKNEKVFIVKEK